MSERTIDGTGEPPRGLAWLRVRLLPGGVATIMFAAYAMLLASLALFALFQRDLPRPAYALGLLALAAMFVLHVVLLDLEARLGEQRAGMLHLALNGALWLLVSWLSLGSDDFTFTPYLLYLLIAQAVVTMRPWHAALYSVGLIGVWLGMLWLDGFSAGEIAANAFALSTGLIFVVSLSYVLNLYRAQTERAEALLAQLTAANVALEAARRREKELAVAEERVRIARDIHDGLGHHLTALNVQLQAAARLIERDPARALDAVTTSRELAQAALDEVRQSVAAMRQTPLDGRGLPEALASLVGDFGRRAELDATLAVSGAPVALTAAAAQTLYRAAQEGLTNAQRHGAAATVRLTLAYGPGGVSLTVVDDGAGAAGANGGGFGLAGLRERAEQLGGAFAAGPLPAGGFQLRIAVPARPGEGEEP